MYISPIAILTFGGVLRSTESIWSSVLGEIELSTSRASFATWFKNTRLLQVDDETATVSVPNIFAKQQLESKFNDHIKEVLKKNDVNCSTVSFVVGDAPLKRSRQYNEPRHVQIDASPKKNGTTGLTLNEKYQFDSFVVGPSNELAYTACLSVAKNPGVKYNPLFIYGGVGLGKTHLIQAIGNTIKEEDPSANIVYIATETFVNEFMNQIRFKKKGFTDKYRKADVLIIDDIQFIAGKEKTQEEFFHTFNALHQANKQIILTSDVPPRQIPTIDDRLRTRFEGGMAIDIQLPDYETRYAIIENKAATLGVDFPSETIEYLAESVQSNVREIEGVINRIVALSELKKINPSREVAASVVGERRRKPVRLRPKFVVEKTADHFQIAIADITGPKRDKDIVFPRQVAMYLLRTELHLSFPKVARELGRKDHTTAMHSVEKIQKALSDDVYVREQVSLLKEVLYV